MDAHRQRADQAQPPNIIVFYPAPPDGQLSPFPRYDLLEERKAQMANGWNRTLDVLVLTENQMSTFEITTREIIIGLRRALLILLSNITRFRLQNPYLTGLSLTIELFALQSLVFEAARYHPMYWKTPNHCFVPIMLGASPELKTWTTGDLRNHIESLKYPDDSIDQILQTFLSLEEWNTEEFYSKRYVIYRGVWSVDLNLPSCQTQLIANGPIPNGFLYSRYNHFERFQPRYDMLVESHIIAADDDNNFVADSNSDDTLSTLSDNSL